MSDSAMAADTRRTWADQYKTSYPRWLRLLQRGLVVWAIGGIPTIAIITIITHPDGPIFGLMGLVWFGVGATLSILIRGWMNSAELIEHVRLLESLRGPGSILLEGHYFQVRDSLLDPSRTRYITGRSASWTDKICDENGRTIGRGIKSHGQGGLYSLHESDGTPILEILPGEPDLNRRPKDTYDITDENEHVLGRVKWRAKGRRSSGDPIVMVLVSAGVEEEPEAGEERELLVAQTEAAMRIGGWTWNRALSIVDEKARQRIAGFGEYHFDIEAPKKWTDRFKKRSVYALYVLDPSYDRRTLLGLAIVCGQKLEEAIVRASNAD
jgi:hypothetical protein